MVATQGAIGADREGRHLVAAGMDAFTRGIVSQRRARRHQVGLFVGLAVAAAPVTADDDVLLCREGAAYQEALALTQHGDPIVMGSTGGHGDPPEAENGFTHHWLTTFRSRSAAIRPIRRSCACDRIAASMMGAFQALRQAPADHGATWLSIASCRAACQAGGRALAEHL